MIRSVLLMLLFVPPATAQGSMADLLDRLGDPAWEVRDRTAGEIVARAGEWTEEDLTLLAGVSESDDPDLRDRAAGLHRRVLVRRRLSDVLVAHGLDAEIDPADPASFDGAVQKALERWRLGGIANSDLTGLVDLALESGYRIPLLGSERDPVPAAYVRLYLADLRGDELEVAVSLLQLAEGTDWLDQIAPLLSSPDASIRCLAADLLADRGATEYAAAIFPLLADPEPKVRAAAARALGLLGVRERAGEIVSLLAESDRETRPSFVDALRNLGARDQAGRIALLLDDPRPEARCAGAEALAAIGARDSGPAIRRLLEDPSSGVAIEAYQALLRLDIEVEAATTVRIARHFGPEFVANLGRRPGETQALAALLSEPSFPHREAALRALAASEEAVPLEPLVASLSDADPGVRATAAAALRRRGDALAVPALEGAVDDPDPRVRKHAAFALLRHRGTADLESALNDPRAEIRDAAAAEVLARRLTALFPNALAILEANGIDALDSLYEIEGMPGESRPLLLSLLSHASPYVRGWACWNLVELATPEDAAAVVLLLADPDWHVRTSAIALLARLEATGHAAAVETRLADSSRFVRLSAASALPRLGSSAGLARALEARGGSEDRDWLVLGLGQLGAIEPIERMLSKPGSPIASGAVAGALAELEAAAFVERILPACDEGEANEIDWRIRALASLGGPLESEAIKLRLGAGLPAIRTAAVEATLGIGGPAVADRLLPLLAERDPALRETVLLGIASWTTPAVAAEVSRHLEDRDPFVRLGAAELHWWIEGRDAGPVLRPLLSAGHPRVRAAAIATAGRIADAASRSAVEEARTSPDWDEVESAIVAAGRLGLSTGRRTPTEDGDRLELEALGRIGDRSDAARAARSLANRSERHLAARVLGRLAAREHAPELAANLPTLGRPAIEALADMGAIEQIPAIARRLDHPSERLEATRALHRLGSPLALDGAAHLVRSPLVQERLEGALLVGEIAALRAAPGPSLALLVEDPCHLVRRAAAIARIELGELDRDAQLALVEEVISFPNFTIRTRWGRRLADALAARHEPDLFRRYATEAAIDRRIETAGDLAAVFDARGLALDANGRLVIVERTHPGSWTGPRRLLERCLAPGKPSLTAWIGRGTARLVTVDEALAAWRAKLAR